MSELQRSRKVFNRAIGSIPGGVNSPVRAFRGVGGSPVFIASGKGAYLTDIDGNRYLDFVGSWGPLLLGHAHPAVVEAVAVAARKGTSFGAPTEAEVELAEMIVRMVPSIEMVRLVNSGTEAAMSAIRLARAFSSREVIVKFQGCYHGHSDSFLIAAGSGATTLGVPDSPGVTAGTAQDTVLAQFNDVDSVESLFRSRGSEIAAVIVEPVAGNMGVVPPISGFLQGLREITARYGSLLIFDEVITGFRLAGGGAQELFGVNPDLAILGKVIGGGLPVGAYGGRCDIMELVAPAGPVYQAGTLSGNPLATAAGLAMLRTIESDADFYPKLERLSAKLAQGLDSACRERGIPSVVNRMGSMMTLFFTGEPAVTDYRSAMTSDRERYSRFFHACLDRGVYLAPSPFEALFVSAVHTEEDLAYALDVFSGALDQG